MKFGLIFTTVAVMSAGAFAAACTSVLGEGEVPPATDAGSDSTSSARDAASEADTAPPTPIDGGTPDVMVDADAGMVAIVSCAVANGGCSAHASCNSTGPGTNTCACNSGYAGDGTNCAAINSCLTNNGGCSSNATCTSTGPATNSCACNTGYNGTGQTCTAVD